MIVSPRGPHGYQVVSPDYSPTLASLSREIPGLVRSGREAYGRPDAVRVLVRELRARGLRVEGEVGHDRPPPPILSALDKSLRPYQREAVAFLLDRKRAILADSMGLGKTRSSIEAAALAGGPVLVVCPAYVVPVWAGVRGSSRGELGKWAPGATVAVCTGDKHRKISVDGAKPVPFVNQETDFFVVSYDSLHSWVRCLPPMRTVILDEAHYLINEKSRRSGAVRTVTRTSPYVFALTGTPMTNRPRDLWNLLDTLCEGSFGAFFPFALRYCGASKINVPGRGDVWSFDGASRLDELGERLRSFMIRRTLRDVALQLPAKTRTILPIPTKFSGSHEALLDVSTSQRRAAFQRRLDEAVEAKLDTIISYALDAAKGGAKVVAFTHRREIASRIAEAVAEDGIPSGLIHGGLDPSKRAETAARLQGYQGGAVLAATIDSAGVGIDLSWASTGIAAELVTEPHKFLQAEARLHRHGQTLPVQFVYPIAIGTIDEIVARVIVSRLSNFEEAVGTTGESLGTDLEGASETSVMADLYAAIDSTATDLSSLFDTPVEGTTEEADL